MIRSGGSEIEISMALPRYVMTDIKVSEEGMSSAEENQVKLRCKLCMKNMYKNEVLKILPCFHVYHEACLTKWLKDKHGWCDAEPKAPNMKTVTSTSVAKTLMINDDSEKSPQERLNIFYNSVTKLMKTGKIDDLQCEAERLNIKDKAVLVLCQLLLGEHILENVKTHRLLFLRFTHGNLKAQKYLLGGLEQVINLHKYSQINQVEQILKFLYEADILQKEVLIDWSQKVSKKYVSKDAALEIRNNAQPFIKQLEKVEYKMSSSDEDGDDAEEVSKPADPKPGDTWSRLYATPTVSSIMQSQGQRPHTDSLQLYLDSTCDQRADYPISKQDTTEALDKLSSMLSK